MNEYVPYLYNGKTLLIQRYGILCETSCAEKDYNLFDMEMDEQIRQTDWDHLTLSSIPIFDDLDREQFNTFQYRDAQNKKYSLYAQVISRSTTKVIVHTSCSKGKLWINGHCAVIHGENYMTDRYFTVTLQKGMNHLILETMPGNSRGLFSLQLKNYRYEMEDHPTSLADLRCMLNLDGFIIIHDSNYCPTDKCFRFMLMQNHPENYEEGYRLEVHNSHHGFFKKMTAKINQMVEIDIEELRQLYPEKLRHEWFGCFLKDKEGKDIHIGFSIILKDFMAAASEISEQLLVAAREQSTEIHTYCTGIIQQQNMTQKGNLEGMYWITWKMTDILQQFRSGTYPHVFYKQPGIHDVFIHSDLDDSVIRVAVRVPQNYQPEKAYPAFIYFATGNDGFACHSFPESHLTEPCLCFDVTGRGFTGGSYIGEACSLEVLDWIRSHYKLDEDRLYFLGSSNGGFAAYALAQNHPHLPAAIFPLIGYPQVDTLENISHIPTYQLVSPKDHIFTGRENQVKNRIGRYGNYHQYNFQEMIHHHFAFYLFHTGLLNSLLTHKRQPYPDTIRFKTFRNRHLKCGWIQLHGIRPGAKYAKITATLHENTICLTVSGTNGFTLTIPPQINKQNFIVVIKSKHFYFEDYKDNTVDFVHDRCWKIAKTVPTVDFRKGTGLLDIYLNSLRIIVPDAPTESMQRMAENFSLPVSNGYDPHIFVAYPIYQTSAVPNHIFSHNLILLDQEMKNPYAHRIYDHLPVKYDRKGFTYQGKDYSGDYVLMQVIPNPFDRRLSILVVSYNSEEALRRHILLRKIIIPTYSNGIHKYWNNEILAFHCGKYLAAYEHDAALQPIEIPGSEKIDNESTSTDLSKSQQKHSS